MLYQVRLSETIANEYMTRAVFMGDDEFPYVPAKAGLHSLPRETILAIHDDADHQIEDGGFARDNIKTSHDIACRNAYLALRKQTADILKTS